MGKTKTTLLEETKQKLFKKYKLFINFFKFTYLISQNLIKIFQNILKSYMLKIYSNKQMTHSFFIYIYFYEFSKFQVSYIV